MINLFEIFRLLILGFFNRVVRIKKIKKTKEEKEKEKAEREKEKEKENEKGSGKEKDESEGKKLKKRPKKETAEEGKKASFVTVKLSQWFVSRCGHL